MVFHPGRPWIALWCWLGAALLAACPVGRARAGSWLQLPETMAQALSPEMQCRNAIKRQEAASGMPASLMVAISLIESGRRLPNGEFAAWPWSINAQGVDHVY